MVHVYCSERIKDINVQSEPVIPNSADNESQRHASNDLQITTQKTSEFGTLLNKKKVRR